MRYKFCNSCGAKIELTKTCDKCEAAKKQEKNAYMRQYNKRQQEVQKPIKTARWHKLRRYIIQRDKGICQRCLALKGIFNSADLQVHHIKPRIKFPELMFDESNLITLCKTCNLELGTQEHLDFTRQIEDEEKEYHL